MRRAPVQGARDFVGDAVGNEGAAGAAKQLQRDVVAYCERDVTRIEPAPMPRPMEEPDRPLASSGI